jgi:leucyl/phenylalanyl-tRNA--protein transferase
VPNPPPEPLPAFPDPGEGPTDSPLAVGGDLSPDRLRAAYRSGIFPWYEEGLPILWWSPDPRFVLFPERFTFSRRLTPRFESLGEAGRLTLNRDFRSVIEACAQSPRRGQDGTWITPDMIEAYTKLNAEGDAHSIEVWNRDGQVIGGLYGILVGRCFCGESMFAAEPDASKFALAFLVSLAREAGIALIDCQQPTRHLARFGAESITRADFLSRLAELRDQTILPGIFPAPSP